MARFVMGRVADLFHVIVSWDPKPVQGDWAGCGCSVGFSTAETRVPGNGWGEIERQLGRLVQPDKHRMHMQAYGIGLERRTGAAAIMMPQSWSVGESPGSSLHVPLSTARKRCGYFVDSRPGASVDPYIAVLLLLSTALEIPLPERASAEQDGSALHAAGGQNVSVGSPILRRFGAMGPGSNQGGSHHGAGGSYHSAHTQQMVGAVHGLARGGSGAGTSFHEQLAWMTMGAVGHGRGDGGSMHGGASGRHGSHGRRISSRAERDRGPNLTGSGEFEEEGWMDGWMGALQRWAPVSAGMDGCRVGFSGSYRST